MLNRLKRFKHAEKVEQLEQVEQVEQVEPIEKVKQVKQLEQVNQIKQINQIKQVNQEELMKEKYFANYINPMNNWCDHLKISKIIIHNTWMPIYLNEDSTSLFDNMLFTKFIHCKNPYCIQCSCMLMIIQYTS